MAATGSEFVKLQQLKTAMDSKQPDMTGVVKYTNGNLLADGSAVTEIIARDNTPKAYSFIRGSGATASVAAVSGSRVIGMSADGSSVEFSMDPSPSPQSPMPSPTAPLEAPS